MYISDLKIQGFKTFVKKTSLHFGEGITAVVGPNGCGKTNIVDAIRWVLGEQKSSVLRGGKLEDVIFNGAEGMKPLSMCEVSLTVHNNKGKLPIEYTDVEITRRAYRDGESEYFINRTPCRLKDIHDLFMDTGMGADAYSVIELGMIESILSETRDDRKRMFEEAAGINKYKLERRSALRKFEAVNIDLERINDIITEVEAKVHSLALQLKRFKRHTALAEKLQEQEIALAYLKTNFYQGQLKPLQERISELRHLRESNVSISDKKDTELARLKEVYRSQRGELDEIQRQLAEIESRREATSNTIIVQTEQMHSTAANIERLNAETEHTTRKRTGHAEAIEVREQEVAELDPQIAAKLEEFKTRRADLESIDEKFQQHQEEVTEIQNERWNAQQRLSDLRARLERTRQLLKEQETGLSQMEQRLAESEKQRLMQADEQKQLEGEKGELDRTVTRIRTGLEKARNDQTGQQEKQRQLENDRQIARSRLEALRSQLAFYRELLEKNDGYPDGVRHVLENRSAFPGVLGSIGDLFQIGDRYAPALESALGTLSYCLVAEDRPAALATLRQVQKSRAGHVSIIPLKELTSITRNPAALPENSGGIARMVDLIKTDRRYTALANHLFGNLLLVDDLTGASENTSLNAWDLVDKTGAYVGADYLVKNSQSTGNVTVIGRQQKIDELQAGEKQLTGTIERLSSELEQLKSAAEKQRQAVRNLEKSSAEHNDRLNKLETALIRNHYAQSRTLEEIRDLTTRMKTQREKQIQTAESIKVMEPQVAGFEADLSATDAKVKHAASQLEQQRQERDKHNRQVQELRIEAMNLENQRENLRFQQRTARETIGELEARLGAISEEVKALDSRKVELAESITGNEKALLSINSQIKQQRSVKDLKQKVFDDTYTSIEELENQIRSEQRDREALLEELRECEVKSAEYTQQIKLVAERIADRYSAELPDRLVVDASEAELALDIERTQRSIDGIGPINMAVQAEHAEEEERLQLLSEQREDLIKSEENLRETIQKIDQVARRQFLDTFTAIKGNFERMFSLFFEGGEGTLNLSGDPDPLEADIAIFAQPPGKRNQSLRVLSAGEKALTAIALLFSIYQVKPSPYCILDEVDAPLDDVNIHKFTRVLHRFSDETQFIVVTHNKLTMEATNYLYGVTMERKGVSKVVSVKFED